MTVAWFGNSTQPSVWFGDRRLIYDPTPPEPGQVVFTTAGGVFAPVIELASGSSATIEWLDTNGTIITTGLTPSITGYAQVRMRCSNYADITTVNLGYNVNEDAGQYSPGASYNKYSTDITGIEGLSNLTGLVRFMAAGTQLTGHVDFTGLSALEFIECFNARVQSVDLTGCTSLIRLCLEANSLSNLDLNPVRNNLRDLRSAVQSTPSLTFTTLDGPMAQLYHYCIRDQTVLNIIPHAQLPVIEEHWAWNTGQTTSDAPTSPLLRSYASYGNAYDQTSVDLILTTLAGLITNGAWRSVDLSGGAEPSAAGWTAVTTLRNNGWNVVVAGTEPVEPSPVLLGSWPLTDSLVDVSGNEHDAVALMPDDQPWTPTYVDGPLAGSRAVAFPASGYSIQYGRTGLEPTTQGFTSMVWARSDVAGSPFGAFTKSRAGNSTRSGISCGGGTNNGASNIFRVARWKDHLNYNDEPGVLPVGVWTHFALYDGDDGWAFYVNGELYSSEVNDRSSGGVAWEDYPWASGRIPDLNGGAAATYVSMPKLFHGKLTGSQIKNEMNRVDNTATLLDTPENSIMVLQESDAYTLGTEFNVVDNCELLAIRWWQGTGTPDLSTRTANVWKQDGGNWTPQLVAPVEIPGSSTANTWLYGNLSAPILLTPGVYRVGIFHPQGHFSATDSYFAGNALVTRGPLTLPYQGIATNNQQGNYSAEATIHAPDQPPYQSRNYWSDVVVRPL